MELSLLQSVATGFNVKGAVTILYFFTSQRYLNTPTEPKFLSCLGLPVQSLCRAFTAGWTFSNNFETTRKTSFNLITLSRVMLATLHAVIVTFPPLNHKTSSLLSVPYQLGLFWGFLVICERSRYILEGTKNYSGYMLMTLKQKL